MVAHTQKTTVTKATTSKNGKIVYVCSKCNKKMKSDKVIYYPKTIKLSKTPYTYNGKVRKPSVTVKDSKGKTIAKSNYTVAYSGKCKSIGKYKVIVTFKGNYTGKVTKTYKIVPNKVSISKPKAAKKKVTVKYKKTSGGCNYQIAYKQKGTSKWKYTTTKSTSKTISKLKSKKYYQVKVRAYKKVSGTNYYSAWSFTKTVKVK